MRDEGCPNVYHGEDRAQTAIAAKVYCRGARASFKIVVPLTGDRGFESGFVDRRVRCEPDFVCPKSAATYFAYAPLPVHIVTPEGRLSVPKVRAFVDFAVARLRAQFARLTADAGA
jgi:hypothetical protein